MLKKKKKKKKKKNGICTNQNLSKKKKVHIRSLGL